MVDERIVTFLRLCQLMNYRRTAEELHMTQPAVTQHIHYLEKEYGCRLFTYSGRVLSKTPECAALERHARSVLYNEKEFREQLKQQAVTRISVGATKTIGDFTLEDKILELLGREDIDLELIIDNTENLLALLNGLKLDVLLIEGYFNKGEYGSELIKREELVGICARDHRFAGKTVALEDLFSQQLILREEGSGTRAVFEEFLHANGYLTERFRKRSVISSFRLITRAVSLGCGISFVYEAIPADCPELATFRLKEGRIFHEYNYVFLQNTDVRPYLDLLRS